MILSKGLDKNESKEGIKMANIRRLYLFPFLTGENDQFSRSSPLISVLISVGNRMICIDIWHKYHNWYFEIVIGI